MITKVMSYHIEYEKVESYDMEDYSWDDADSWYESVLKQYSEMRAWKGREDNLTPRTGPIDMPPNHKTLLKRALKNRIANKNKANMGYMIFKRIMGEYIITIDDMTVVEKRMRNLTELANLFNSDPRLSTIDPNPSGAFLDAVQLKEVEELSVEAALRQAVIMTAFRNPTKLNIGNIMNYITQNFSYLNDKKKDMVKLIPDMIKEYTTLSEKEIASLVKKEYPNLEEEEPEPEIYTGKITYYFPAGNYNPKSIYYELGSEGNEKEINIESLIRKVKDKKLQQKMYTIRPGGPDWPESAGGKYYLIVTNNAIDMVCKSTHRYWHNTSCENYGGAYNQGPFSDVDNGNCIVYIFKGDEKPIGWPLRWNYDALKGRTLLRWGLKDNQEGQYGVGMERRVYPSNKTWGLPVATGIGMILGDQGFLDYKKLRTPYTYKGWADTMRKANTQIVYEGFIMEGQKIDLQSAAYAPELNLAASPLISYSDLHRLSRASMDIRVKRVLAENPSVWQFPEVVGRLIRTEDLVCLNMISSHDIADGEALHQIMDFVLSKDDFELMTGSQYDNIIRTIVANPNCLEKTHQLLYKIAEVKEAIYNAYYSQFSIDTAPWDLYSSYGWTNPAKKLLNPYVTNKQLMELMNSETLKTIGSGLLNSFIDLICIPHTQKGDWGFRESITANYSPTISNTLLSLSIPWKKKYKEERQTLEMVKAYVEKISSSTDSKLSGDLANTRYLLANVRSQRVYKYLVDSREELDIPSWLLNYAQIDRETFELKNDFYYTDKIEQIFYEESPTADLPRFRFIYEELKEIPKLKSKYRKTLQPKIVMDLIKNPFRAKSLGLNWIGYFLPKNLSMQEDFQELIFKMAFGTNWENGKLKPLPDVMDDFEVWDEMVSQCNIGILKEVVIGNDVLGEVGLIKNPNLLEPLQYNILGMPNSNPNWVESSLEYQGNYSEHLSNIQKAAVLNPSLSGGIMEFLARYENLQRDIALNPNCSAKLLTGRGLGGYANSLLSKYPAECLSNPSLSTAEFNKNWQLVTDILKLEVNPDVDRLYHNFTAEEQSIISLTGSKGRKKVQSILQANSNWIRYWRAGTTKKGVFSPYSKLNLFTGTGGISDYPIHITDKKSVFFKFTEDDYLRNQIWYLDKTKIKGDDIVITGTLVEIDSETNLPVRTAFKNKVYNMDKFFDHIQKDNRGPPVKKYICSYCQENNGKEIYRLSEDELQEHYERSHPDEQFLYVEGEREPEKWTYSNMFMFTDFNPPQADVEIPLWRYSWDAKKMEMITKAFVKRNSPYQILFDWYTNTYRIDAPETPQQNTATMSAKIVLEVMDELSMISEGVLNRISKIILKGGANSLFNQIQWKNLKLSREFLDITLAINNDQLSRYELTLNDLDQQTYLRILSYPDLPVSYLYTLYENSVMEVVIQAIKNIRMDLAEEFNEYILANTEANEE